VRQSVVARNPVADVERPTINRDECNTAAFPKSQPRKRLDTPPADTVTGLRDRAIVAVGCRLGFAAREIAALTLGDLHQNLGEGTINAE